MRESLPSGAEEDDFWMDLAHMRAPNPSKNRSLLKAVLPDPRIKKQRGEIPRCFLMPIAWIGIIIPARPYCSDAFLLPFAIPLHHRLEHPCQDESCQQEQIGDAEDQELAQPLRFHTLYTVKSSKSFTIPRLWRSNPGPVVRSAHLFRDSAHHRAEPGCRVNQLLQHCQ